MGKAYEALARAEKENQKNKPKYSPKSKKSILAGTKIQADVFTASKPFDDLKANLLSRFVKSNVKSILFNGISKGTGCTTTALSFSNSLIIDSERKVLFVDLNLSFPHLGRVRQPNKTINPTGFIADGKRLEARIEKVGHGNLYMMSCGARSLYGPDGSYETSDFQCLINSIYNNFDFLILDAPPVLVNSKFRILCSQIDGVVLIIDSGNVRRQVALKAKEEIEEAGGTILGVVINRRKYYIPEWIYKRL